ncbi:MAG: DUF1573 domain-containing protein [Bacteroidales bacterium]|nr:DUF1573 domain-containing protein [Bacteroidales bacterium]
MRKFFTIFAITVFFVSISCTKTAGKNNAGKDGPKIEFTYTEYDYGTVTQGGDGTSEFVFRNTGNEPLILSNVRSTCGCTVPSWPKEPVKPGETAKITVVYSTNRIGPINKSVIVSTNADSQPVVLKIKGNVVPKPAENEQVQAN